MNIDLKRNNEELKMVFNSLMTLEDIANLLEISTQTLNYYAYNKFNYTKFIIPKRNGSDRIIYSPQTNVKILQKKILYILNLYYIPNDYTFGFITGKNIVDNAKIHLNKENVLNIDLSDFFPSINFSRVKGYLQKHFNFNDFVSRILSKIICVESSDGTFLPQGGSTSPIISNLISNKLDNDLSSYCKRYRCLYSRYADDITISNEDKKFPEQIAFKDIHGEVWLNVFLEKKITSNGFQINFEKVRLRSKHQRQEVTGLIVNGKKVNVRREYIRELRAILFNWEKKGYDLVQKKYESIYVKKYDSPYKLSPKIEKVIEGKLNFLSMIRGKDDPLFQKLKYKFTILKKTLPNS